MRANSRRAAERTRPGRNPTRTSRRADDCSAGALPPESTWMRVAEDRADGDRERPQLPQAADRQKQPQRPAPARRRQATVGEQQDRQPRADDRRSPGRLQQDGQPSERHVPMQPVIEHRHGGGVTLHREEERDTEQQPADRIAGLMPRHDEPDRRRKRSVARRRQNWYRKALNASGTAAISSASHTAASNSTVAGDARCPHRSPARADMPTSLGR